MHAGVAFRETVDGCRFTVIYTGHFVLRCTTAAPGRPAVLRRTITEAAIQAKIAEGLSEICEYLQRVIRVQGVIFAAKLQLNMSFSVRRERDGGYTLIMQNAMAKPDYDLLSPHDYLVRVNPALAAIGPDGIVVELPRGVGPALRVATLGDLVATPPESLEDGQWYPLRGEWVEMLVSRDRDTLFVEETGWIEEGVEVIVA